MLSEEQARELIEQAKVSSLFNNDDDGRNTAIEALLHASEGNTDERTSAHNSLVAVDRVAVSLQILKDPVMDILGATHEQMMTTMLVLAKLRVVLETYDEVMDQKDVDDILGEDVLWG